MPALTRHPQSEGGQGFSLEADVMRGTGGRLALRYRVSGPVAHLRLPPPAFPERTDGLWRTTCFEAFVDGGAGGYLELNFATSGHWAAYRFTGYREGMAPAETQPAVEVGREGDLLELVASVSLEEADLLPEDAVWQVSLTAVLEDLDGRISYWALTHAGDKPDFHHPDSFTLQLPPTES